MRRMRDEKEDGEEVEAEERRGHARERALMLLPRMARESRWWWWREGVPVLRGHVERVMREERRVVVERRAREDRRGERERERRWRSVCVPACVYTLCHSDVWRDPSV